MTSQKEKKSGALQPSPLRFTRFVACVARPESAESLAAALPSITQLAIVHGKNVAGVDAADIVLLSCKPQAFRSILSEPGIREGLAGKLLISILAGVTVEQIESHLYGTTENVNDVKEPPRCRVVRVMPNTASEIGQSMSVIASSQPPLTTLQLELVRWMFSQIGKVVILPPQLMDASTALCGSGPAFFALMAEAMTDGAVAMGVPRKEAQVMAAQTMKGTADLILTGQHPALLRDKVSTPGGCTIGGLLIMEEGTVRGTIARAVREATVVAGKLGAGASGVNGTWR